MPRDHSINSVLVIGSGPIVIGQACEFDYSGTQACRVLKAEGIRVILVNSNPATIMTDPEFADATYIEPITPHFLEEIIKKEKPDAILVQMTLGLDIQEPSAIIEDRAVAIRTAVNEAQAGDVVIVLGKGHEKGQEISGINYPFDDRVELAKAIEDKK